MGNLQGYCRGWRSCKRKAKRVQELYFGTVHSGYRNRQIFPNERAVIKAGYKLPQDVQNKTLTECWSLIYHTVFNIEQAEGIETKVDATPQNPEHVAIPSADDIYI